MSLMTSSMKPLYIDRFGTKCINKLPQCGSFYTWHAEEKWKWLSVSICNTRRISALKKNKSTVNVEQTHMYWNRTMHANALIIMNVASSLPHVSCSQRCVHASIDTSLNHDWGPIANARPHSKLSIPKAVFDYLIYVAHSLFVVRFSIRFVYNIFCDDNVYPIAITYPNTQNKTMPDVNLKNFTKTHFLYFWHSCIHLKRTIKIKDEIHSMLSSVTEAEVNNRYVTCPSSSLSWLK